MKQKILLIPGWACKKEIWKKTFVETFSNYDLILSSWTDFIDNESTDKFINDNDLTKEPNLIIIGWSLGGIQTINLHKKLKNKLQGIILISTTACLGEKDNYFGVPVKFLDIMKKQIIEKRTRQLMQFFANFMSPNKDMDLIKSYIKTAKAFNDDILFKGLEYLQESDLRNDIFNIELPVLIIHGKEDKIVPYQQSEYLNKNIKNSKLHLFEDLGHDLVLRKPEAISTLIKDFISAKI